MSALRFGFWVCEFLLLRFELEGGARALKRFALAGAVRLPPVCVELPCFEKHGALYHAQRWAGFWFGHRWTPARIGFTRLVVGCSL